MGNTPNIRFKGYTDDWKQRKLGEICERVTRKNKNGESDLPLTIASQYGLIDQRDFFNKVVAAKDMSNYYLLKRGEFAYNKSYSNGYDYGSIKRLNAYEQGCLSTLYICFGITSDEVESDYLECFFDTLMWYEDVAQICAEGARNHGLLNVDTKGFFDEVSVFLPPTNEEQRRISTYLNNLDTLITLHQRKCFEVKNLKKFMLQKMFPKNGEVIPEIRFAGFTDDWKQRKCGDVLIERNVQHPQSDEFPLVSFTVENGVTPKTDRYEREQLVRGDKKAKKYKETRIDDIVYNPANLKFGAIARNKYGNAVFSPIYVTYEVNQDLALPSFVEMSVTRESFIQNALQYQQGTVYERMAVNTEDFATLEIMLPSKEEQTRIGKLLSDLDNLITLHQRKCDELKEIKRYMLQNMFPQKG